MANRVTLHNSKLNVQHVRLAVRILKEETSSAEIVTVCSHVD